MTTLQTPLPAVTVPGQAADSTTPIVYGLDLSMTSTGVACSLGWTERVTSSGHRGDSLVQRNERLRFITSDITGLVRSDADLVVVEGPSYGSSGAGTWDRAGLWWRVVGALIRVGHLVVELPPTVRMKYATGKGNASKDAVLIAAVKRFPGWDIDGNDTADSMWIMAAGMDALGHPLAVMPAVNRTALDGVAWPENLRRAA